jgi:hypothetical protein
VQKSSSVKKKNDQSEVPKSRLILAAAIIVLSLASAALIPLVLMLPVSSEVKTTLSGLLIFGIPQGLTAIAIAVVGKKGYQYLKGRFFKLIMRQMPADKVSNRRYNLGLIMLVLPLMLAWAHPFLAHFIPKFQTAPLWVFICSDILLISSFFVLGGDFWDKLRGLFKHDVIVSKSK